MGKAGYDWVAVDLEHGSVSIHQLPDLFRALELGNSLPLARVAQGDPKDCKQALDAGAGGLIVPNIESAQQLIAVRDACCWPPAGTRGVGFSRANLFGRYFDAYREEAQAPLLVAMIESCRAVQDLGSILSVEGLDAILIGPYDLSASMALTGRFDHPDFCAAMETILMQALARSIPVGVHVVIPEPSKLQQCIGKGHRFIAYGIDSVFLQISACLPTLEKQPDQSA
jgi:2-dehydro-3-deoxyglucarate aldolase